MEGVVSSTPAAGRGFVSSAMKKSKDTTLAMADSTVQLAASALSTSLTMVLVVAVSTFLYGTFYFAYIPIEMADAPFNLGFEPCDGQTADRCSFPSASLAIGRQQQMLHGQAYSIRVLLQLPDSPRNEALGMFMACMNITSTDGALVSRSCRSSLAQYRSPLLRGLETLAFLPALLTGWSQQQQSLVINFFDAFHPDIYMVAQNIHVELKSRLLQVTHASVHLQANLSGLRYVIYRHPWLSAVLGVGTNILILLTIITVSWTSFRMQGTVSWNRFRMQGSSSTAVESEEPDEEEEDEEEEEEREGEDEDEAGDCSLAEGQETLTDHEDLDQVTEAAHNQTLSSRFMGFVIKTIFKVLWHVVKVVLFVGAAVACYELARLGPDTTREALLEAAKEDLKGVAVFSAKHMKNLVAALSKQ